MNTWTVIHDFPNIHYQQASDGKQYAEEGHHQQIQTQMFHNTQFWQCFNYLAISYVLNRFQKDT